MEDYARTVELGRAKLFRRGTLLALLAFPVLALLFVGTSLGVVFTAKSPHFPEVWLSLAVSSLFLGMTSTSRAAVYPWLGVLIATMAAGIVSIKYHQYGQGWLSWFVARLVGCALVYLLARGHHRKLLSS